MEEEKKEFDNVDVKSLIDKVSNLEQDKANLVSELKEIRASRQEIEKKVAEVEKKATEEISKFVVEEKQKKLDSAKKVAHDKFLATFKEFHPDNDTGGIKYQALQKELDKLNLEKYGDSEEAYYSALQDAAIMLSQKGKQVKSNLNKEFAATPRENAGDIKGSDNPELSAKEIKLLKTWGWDEARYLKVKSKRPEYVESLLRFMN